MFSQMSNCICPRQNHFSTHPASRCRWSLIIRRFWRWIFIRWWRRRRWILARLPCLPLCLLCLPLCLLFLQLCLLCLPSLFHILEKCTSTTAAGITFLQKVLNKIWNPFTIHPSVFAPNKLQTVLGCLVLCFVPKAACFGLVSEICRRLQWVLLPPVDLVVANIVAFFWLPQKCNVLNRIRRISVARKKLAQPWNLRHHLFGPGFLATFR